MYAEANKVWLPLTQCPEFTFRPSILRDDAHVAIQGIAQVNKGLCFYDRAAVNNRARWADLFDDFNRMGAIYGFDIDPFSILREAFRG